MSTTKKPKYTRIVSPAGIARYAWLNTPDTKFKADGEYKVTLRVPAADAEAFIAACDAEVAKARPDFQAKIDADPKLKASFKKANRLDAKGKLIANSPYSEALNDAGEATGEVDITFKMAAKVTSKKTGEVFEKKPVLIDAKKNVMPAGVVIWSGSTLKVRCELVPYCAPVSGFGVSLRMDMVQVKELATRGANTDGFDDEDGYEADEENAAPAGEATGDESDEF